nr:catalase family protein [Janibacter alkaliphilus]
MEQVQPDEERISQEIVAHMAEQQAAHALRHRHAHRDAHAKSHALLAGRLAVHEGLPPAYAQGIFAEPGTYDVLVRLSSAPGDIHSDEVPEPRGMALKVLDVPGERLDPSRDGCNQDLLMVNIPVLAFGTVTRYQQMLGLLEKNAAQPALAQRGVAAVARTVEKIVERGGRPPGATLAGLASTHHHPLGETYHSQGALRHGDHVAKVSVAPTGATAELTGRSLSGDFDAIRETLVEHFATAGATYELRVQLSTDREAMPVEDAAVAWDPELAPHVPVATLELEPQDVGSPARQVYGDDHLSFDPWNGVVAHRPLGSIMRVRRLAYASSSQQRHRLNDIPMHEPRSLADVPR